MGTDDPKTAVCCKCWQFISEAEVVRYRTDGRWRKWCWPCFKTNHLRNLTRLQEGNK